MTTPKITEAELARLEELEKAATEGPWEEHEITEGWALEECEPYVISRGIKGLNHGEEIELFDKEDVLLIVALRNAAPALIAAARESARLREALHWTCSRLFELADCDVIAFTPECRKKVAEYAALAGSDTKSATVQGWSCAVCGCTNYDCSQCENGYCRPKAGSDAQERK